MPMNIDRLTDLFGLDGKVAVVTGGSRGIGYMVAGGLLDAGCRVIVSARKADGLPGVEGRVVPHRRPGARERRYRLRRLTRGSPAGAGAVRRGARAGT